MNFKRVTFSVLLLFVSVFAFASVTKGTSDLMELKTEHFEIIYDADSAYSAQKLFESCEDIYKDVLSLFPSDNSEVRLGNIPVVITSEKKTYNGFFSNYPSNEIVLYNSPMGIGNMTNYQDNLLDMFRHELTHAMLFNYRSGSVDKAANIFSDALALTPVYVWHGFSEGLSVFSESRFGSGRLNDPSVTAKIRQAKQSNQFPSWTQMTGAKDTYPYGDLLYYFSGAFIGYLVETYGAGKCSEYLNECSKFHFLTSAQLFERVMGISAENAWRDFESSIDLPVDVIESLTVIGDKADYSNLVMSEDGRIFVIDNTSASLCELRDSQLLKTELCVDTYDCSLSVSADGSFVLPFNDSDYDKVLVYNSDFVKKESYRGYRSGCIVNDNLICLLKVKGDYSYLNLVDRISSEEIKSLFLGNNVNTGFFCSDGQNVYFILSENGKDSIALFDTVGGELFVFDFPERIFVRSMNYHDSNLYFSYYRDDSFARLGEFNTKSFRCRLSQIDVNGGVSYPVVNNASVTFISLFHDGNIVSSMGLSELKMSDIGCLPNRRFLRTKEEHSILKASKYKVLRHFSDFSFIPFVMSAGLESADFTDISPVGFSLITKDPTETWAVITGGGWNFRENSSKFRVAVKNSSLPVRLSVSGYYDKTPENKVVGVCLSAEYTHYFNSLLNGLSFSQTVDFHKDTLLENTIITKSSTYIGYFKYGLMDFIRRDYTGCSFAFQLDVEDSGTHGLSGAFSWYPHIEKYAPKIKTGFYVGKNENGYIWAQGTVSPIRHEIQRGFGIFYVNRITADCSYLVFYYPGLSSSVQSVSGKIYATVTPLQGMATELKFDVGVKVDCLLKYNPEIKPSFYFSVNM